MLRNVTNVKGTHQTSISLEKISNPISSSWPLDQWGLDIMGLFPQAMGTRRFVVVAIDYFTKMGRSQGFGGLPRCRCEEISLEEHCH